MADAPIRPRFQFSLLTLFVWMVALSILFALATLPYPVNAYFAPLYSSLLFGYLGSRSVWLSAILGGLACLVAGSVVMAIEMNQPGQLTGNDTIALASVGGCCCLPIGAYLGLAVGVFARERRDKRRFKSRLKALYLEIGNPCPPARPADEPAPPDPKAQGDADD